MFPIYFFAEDIASPIQNTAFYQSQLLRIISDENCVLRTLTYIFCSDEFLYTINEKYLNHPFYTDVITFNHAEENSNIEGDIYISLHRIADNAKTFSTSFHNELHRVMIHGLLHLIGYDDHVTSQQKLMRAKENLYLPLFVL